VHVCMKSFFFCFFETIHRGTKRCGNDNTAIIEFGLLQALHPSKIELNNTNRVLPAPRTLLTARATECLAPSAISRSLPPPPKPTSCRATSTSRARKDCVMHTFACEFAPSVRVRMCMRMLVPVTPLSSLLCFALSHLIFLSFFSARSTVLRSSRAPRRMSPAVSCSPVAPQARHHPPPASVAARKISEHLCCKRNIHVHICRSTSRVVHIFMCTVNL